MDNTFEYYHKINKQLKASIFFDSFMIGVIVFMLFFIWGRDKENNELKNKFTACSFQYSTAVAKVEQYFDAEAGERPSIEIQLLLNEAKNI